MDENVYKIYDEDWDYAHEVNYYLIGDDNTCTKLDKIYQHDLNNALILVDHPGIYKGLYRVYHWGCSEPFPIAGEQQPFTLH